MKGINQFTFNQSTMNEIVLHYLKTVMLKDAAGLDVTQITYNQTQGSSFIVTVAIKDNIK